MTTRRMTWDQIVEEYPDMWVAIANPVFDGDHPDILEGDVVAVAKDDVIGDVKSEHRGEGLRYRRTTESGWNGIFYADFRIITV